MGKLLTIRSSRLIASNFCFRNPSKFEYKDDMDTEIINEIDKVGSMTENQTSDYGLVLKNLMKKYEKGVTLNLLSVAIRKGSCYEIICANSVIRSSIFKMITRAENISSGDIFVGGKSFKDNPTVLLNSFGYCSKDCNLFRHMTGRENLKIFGSLKGFSAHLIDEKIKYLANELNFAEVLDKLVKGYNERHRKLLGLAVALIGDPEVIILEEPTLHLDANVAHKVFRILGNLKADGKTILILSNDVIPIDSIFDKILVIEGGEMKFLDTPESFKHKYSNGLDVAIELRNYDTENEKLSKVVEITNFLQNALTDLKLRYN